MTPSFDSLRYVAGYADLIAAYGTDEDAARRHYDAHGRAEGRDPFKFNPLAYGAAHADLIRVYGDNDRELSLHYIRYGFAERRTVTFDALSYGASHADLIRTFGDNAEALTRHFVRHGFAEGRKTDTFDALAYGASHPDLIRTFGDNDAALTRHYVRHGFAEKRGISFDALTYGASHADLIRTFGDDAAALARHYIQHGFGEGRSTATFDALAYGASHADLIRTFGDNAQALARHFIEHGFTEGRTVFFSAAGYAAANPDLDPALAGNAAALTLHFIRTGFAEGRVFATVIGTQNGDRLTGTNGRDVIAGLAGDDVFVGSAGGDRHLGGLGVDTVDYSALVDAVTIERTLGLGTIARHGLASDALVSIERLILGAGNDTVMLDGSPDIVFGGGGTDQILGRGGGDELHGGDGNDVVSSFSFEDPAPGAIDRLFGEGGSDTLILGSRGGIAMGGEGGDQFLFREMAGSATAVMDGGAGYDTASGSLIGNLTIKADNSVLLSDRASGAVRITFTSVELFSFLATAPFGIHDGVVRITGEGGAAIFYAGNGNHEIRGTFSIPDPSNSPGFQLSRGHQVIDATLVGGGRLFFNTDQSTVQAVVRGSTDIEFSISGNSNVVLGDGNDRFVVRAGASTLDGGGGNDSLWILGAAPMSIDLVRGVAADTQGISISFTGIENAFGGEADDVIIGNDEANVLRGLGGNDRIYGGGTGTDGRFDILIGREGDDLLVGGRGYDSLRGELGNDTLIDRADGSFSGDEGDDLIVVLLDDPATSAGHIAYINSDAGADTIIVSALVGTFGDLLFTNFSQAEGDLIDLSNLRDLGGAVIDMADIMAAASVTSNGLRIGLEGFRNATGDVLSGQLLFAGLDAATDLDVGMFVFQNGTDWQRLVPADWIL